MQRSIADMNIHRILKRTRPERRVDHDVAKMPNAGGLIDFLMMHPDCSPSTKGCLKLIRNQQEALIKKFGKRLLAFGSHGSLPRNPTQKHPDIDGFAVFNGNVSLTRMYKRLTVQPIPVERFDYKNLSSNSPFVPDSRLLKDDPSALRRVFSNYLPVFVFHDPQNIMLHVRDLSTQLVTLEDFYGWSMVITQNRMRTLRSAAQKITTTEDEIKVYREVLDKVGVDPEIKVKLLKHHLESVLPLGYNVSFDEEEV